MAGGPCRVSLDGGQLVMSGPSLEVVLATDGRLRPVRWANPARGYSTDLHDAQELVAVLGDAGRRAWIRGWRGTTSVVGACDPDDDPGLHLGYHEPGCDDTTWLGMHTPSHRWYEQDERIRWARTRIALPADARGRPLELVLGGMGLFDFRWMRVFVNGVPLGIRTATGRWREPGRFDIGPGSPITPHLRFDGEDVLALQLAGYMARDDRLDAVDPGKVRLMPLRSQWPAQFEQHIVIGDPDQEVGFVACGVDVRSEGASGAVVIRVASDEGGLEGTLTYDWDASTPVMRRALALRGGDARLHLLRLDLLSARGWDVVSDGEQGSPVYLDDAWFASVEHPAGWAMGIDGRLLLRQHPGVRLGSAGSFDAMTTVVGSAGARGARAAFVDHIASRMRRVRRDHLTPRVIATAFGSWPYDPATAQGAFADVVDVAPTEAIILDHVERIREGVRDGLRVDMYVVDFWMDPAGDVALPDRTRFPRGLAPIREAVEAMGARLGLWLDSSMAEWTIGQNPAVAGTFTHDPELGSERPSLCRAAEPFRTLSRDGMRRLVTEGGARLLKLDNLQSVCHADGHGHLPGVWSTEAIMSAQLEGLRTVDEVAPETFLMLYWGHRSAWWLLDADTLFEPGFWIEAAHPAGTPTLYVRDSVIQGLDQAQQYCTDVPRMGKDSLGVWLSDWKWNSSIGAERWAEAMVMDLCRGGLLAQVWSDRTWLTPHDRTLLAELVALLRASPLAFRDPVPIGGDPWQSEAYGYVCSDGTRAYVALSNASWRDVAFGLDIADCQLPAGRRWQVVRRFPDAAIISPEGGLATSVHVGLRPFDVVLLEILPLGATPMARQPLPVERPSPSPSEPTVRLSVATDETPGVPAGRVLLDTAARRGVPLEFARRTFRMRTRLPGTRAGGTAVPWVRVVRDGRPVALDDAGGHFAVAATLGGHPTRAIPVVRDRTYSVPWQAWRIVVPARSEPLDLEVRVTAALPAGATLEADGAFVPGSRFGPGAAD